MYAMDILDILPFGVWGSLTIFVSALRRLFKPVLYFRDCQDIQFDVEIHVIIGSTIF